MMFLYRIVINAQNFFVFLLHQQLHCFGPLLYQRKSLVHIKGVIIFVIVNEGLQRHFLREHLTFLNSGQVGAFSLFALPPFQLPVAASQEHEQAKLDVRKKKIKANACDSYLEFTVGDALRIRN